MWAVIIQLLLWTPRVHSGPELSFWVENSVQKISVTQEVNIVYLTFNFDFDLVVIKTELTTIRAIYKKFVELKIWENTDIKKEYFYSLEDAVKRFITATTCLGQALIIGSQGTVDLKPKGTCIYNYTTPSENSIREGMRILNSKNSAILTTWTADEFLSDKAKRQLLEEFIFQYNSLSFDWETNMCELSNVMDLLRGGIFPEDLTGLLETVKCVGMSSFENIIVKQCTDGLKIFFCELEFALPKETIDIITLIPLNYFGYELDIPANKTLVKEIKGSKIQLMTCAHDIIWENSNAPMCSIKDSDAELAGCLKMLTKDDVEQILQTCPFSKKSFKPILKLGSGGILIQHPDSIIKENGNTIYQNPPLVIWTNQELQISLHDENLIFHPSNSSVPRILTTRLSRSELNLIISKGSSNDFWKNFYWTDYDEYVMFGLDVVFIPFIIYAITLGIKNRKKFAKIMSKSIKSKRKNNFSENKNLLRQSRL